MSDKTVADYVREHNKMVEEARDLGLRGHRSISNSAPKNLEDARRRCESIASSLRAFKTGQAAADKQEQKETDVAKKTKRVKAEKTEKTTKVRRSNGKGTVRANSTTAKIMALADGTRSLSQIQSRIDAKSSVSAFMSCLQRDHGIKFDRNDGKPKLILPHGKKLEDMVR